MPTDLDQLTLAMALTAAGAVVMAGFITGIIEVLSRTVGPIRGHEQGLALILAAIVVVAAIADAVGTGAVTLGLPSIFAGILAWYGIARASMAIHDDVINRKPTSLGTSI